MNSESIPCFPGALRVWNIINPPNQGDFYPVSDTDEALRLINFMAEIQLLDPMIHSNAFGCHVFQDGEWQEWEDENGYDIISADRRRESDQHRATPN